jgi:hypothetical protein
MNAHINYDLPLSLLGVIDDAKFADPEVVARRNRDHMHIDRVLLGRVGAEDEAITAAHGGKSAYERPKAPLERRATGQFLREARAKVWANTRLMAAARARGDAAALNWMSWRGRLKCCFTSGSEVSVCDWTNHRNEAS